MLVILEEDSVRLSDSKLSDVVFARIYLEYGCGNYFPELGWDDFAEIILGWWIDGVINLFLHDESAVFRFMDGDFSFEIKNIKNGDFSVRLKERSIVVWSENFDLLQFSRSIISASNALVRKVQKLRANEKAAGELILKKNKLQRMLVSYRQNM
ncbi:hypothetical protein [Paracidovorax avenae]|uniref:hypothetical protein n=1 Tax=Paracidovorax avenae TaxID=80867 RepID=UPI0012FE6F8A|nr:hypothetical protein [Paracidovorax avenae]